MKEIPDSIKYSLCLMPWVGSSIKADGVQRLCCNAQANGGALYKKEDGRMYTAKDDGVHEARNCKIVKSIRKEMLSGIRPKECASCWKNEKIRIGKRTIVTTKFIKYVNDVVKYTNEDGSIDTEKFPVMTYDIRFGNLCNCKCLICDYPSSNMFGELIEWKSDESNKYLRELKDGASHIRELYITGGEPFINKHHWEFLDYLINKGESKHINIRYNTNGTLMKKEFIKKWEMFNSIRVSFSIDCIGEDFEKQRYPAKWNKVESNLDLFDRSLTKRIVHGVLAPSLSSLNVYLIPSLLEWYRSKNYSNIKEFYINLLFDPEHYSIIGKRSIYEDVYKVYKPFLNGRFKNECQIILNAILGDKQ